HPAQDLRVCPQGGQREQQGQQNLLHFFTSSFVSFLISLISRMLSSYFFSCASSSTSTFCSTAGTRWRSELSNRHSSTMPLPTQPMVAIVQAVSTAQTAASS